MSEKPNVFNIRLTQRQRKFLEAALKSDNVIFRLDPKIVTKWCWIAGPHNKRVELLADSGEALYSLKLIEYIGTVKNRCYQVSELGKDYLKRYHARKATSNKTSI